MAEKNATTSENNEVTKSQAAETNNGKHAQTEKGNRESDAAMKQTPKTEDKTKSDKAPADSAPNRSHDTVVVKKGGSGLALLAILIALGLGGAGYYFGQQQVAEFQQKLTALENAVHTNAAAHSPASQDAGELEQQRAQLAKLTDSAQSADGKLAQLEKELSIKTQAIDALQTQINRLNSETKAEQPNDWLLSEADFLLNNALRKLVLDNDVDTTVSLLKVADETLEKVSDPHVMTVRAAINSDLKQLLSLNNVDQNTIMQRLSQLANSVDELTVLNVNFDDPNGSDQLSDSWADWKENAEKSAASFLNHFIRITPRNTDAKALLAPNQDIYLRENIRLRLQLAIMAVPRQQNGLYKQSLETVASWVRSYFDTNTEIAQNFLKEIDELAEQSIYVDVPNQLNSLNVLDKLLNKQPQEIQKIEISADKALTEQNADAAKDEKAENAEAQDETHRAPAAPAAPEEQTQQ